ncbi:MAG: cyclic nucleotide-binding domain-containing protein [Betaproteobacteria bacterium]
MPISFGGRPKEDDVVSLIAAKKYARAIEVLKAQLRKKGANPSLRMQLADVLMLADKRNEAISLLLPLADQYANEGFAAKAVSVLKKVQKIDPGRRDVDARLARLIEEKQREAVVLPPVGALGPFGEAAAADAGRDGGDVLEIGFSMAPISVSAPQPSPPPTAEPAPMLAAEPLPVLEAEPAPPAVVEPLPALELAPAALPVVEPDLAPVMEAEPVAPLEAESVPEIEAEPLPAVAAPGEEGGIEDYDLLYAGEGDEEEAPLAAEWVEEEPAQAMSAGQFADELMSLVDDVFQESKSAAPAPAADAPAAGAAAARPGTQIVVSPLFRDFSVDEMVAVIEGLKLLSFERGDVILRQGQPGASLYMLTSGSVRAFRKDAASGKQVPIGDLNEGAFFGEMSVLTGAPRAASIVALTRCELLELDRPTLDGITAAHPRVWDVLREFAAQRSAALVSRMAR